VKLRGYRIELGRGRGAAVRVCDATTARACVERAAAVVTRRDGRERRVLVAYYVGSADARRAAGAVRASDAQVHGADGADAHRRDAADVATTRSNYKAAAQRRVCRASTRRRGEIGGKRVRSS
jgi:hypothetical protein